jgi:hypothetical protein
MGRVGKQKFEDKGLLAPFHAPPSYHQPPFNFAYPGRSQVGPSTLCGD